MTLKSASRSFAKKVGSSCSVCIAMRSSYPATAARRSAASRIALMIDS